ncbi:unnamed protein product [Prunus brigantina]
MRTPQKTNISVQYSSQLITDNIITIFQSVYAVKCRGGSGSKKMIMKLEVFKVYNWVEWSFLTVMLRRLGFNERWVDFIMDCISTLT